MEVGLDTLPALVGPYGVLLHLRPVDYIIPRNIKFMILSHPSFMNGQIMCHMRKLINEGKNTPLRNRIANSLCQIKSQKALA